MQIVLGNEDEGIAAAEGGEYAPVVRDVDDRSKEMRNNMDEEQEEVSNRKGCVNTTCKRV